MLLAYLCICQDHLTKGEEYNCCHRSISGGCRKRQLGLHSDVTLPWSAKEKETRQPV